VGGAYWVANPPLGNGSAPKGWGGLQTEGRWQQTSDTTAIFLADSGVTAAFVRTERPATPDGCD
jgi:hypothetical protein